MKKIAVTGGSGTPKRGVGATIVKTLASQGYKVVNLDIVPPRQNVGEFRHVDLTQYGDTFACLEGCDSVVHLAANANPDFDHFTGAQRFHTNTLAAYNVFHAAVTHGMKRVVWASSETVLGFPFDKVVPPLLPTHDEEPAIPTRSYGVSKAVTENLAEHMNRMSGIPFIGLRFSNIFYDIPGHETGYDKLPAAWLKPEEKKVNLWGYVDHRDIAQGVMKALHSNIKSARNFTLAAADTCMKQTNEELLDLCFPGTKLRDGTGPYDTLVGIDRAGSELFYKPEYSWRDYV